MSSATDHKFTDEDRKAILRSLSGMASTEQRARALIDGVGIASSTVALACSVSEATVSNWLGGAKASKGRRALDSLRIVMAEGLRNGYSPDAMANWLDSAHRNLPGPDGDLRTPLEAVATDRLAVLAALATEPPHDEQDTTFADVEQLQKV